MLPPKNENQDSLKLLNQKDELSSFLSQFPVAFSIDTLDTVVFNLTNATIVGNMLEFPVTFHSDDYVYSMDFH
ncbi:MAG: hypothetical protein IPP71_13300 [Bacteroidetes bacterium]|nr:hypothetical protein [Bacteroidota bacterium]